MLFLLKKFNELENTITEWVKYLFEENDSLGVSNLLRLFACLKLYERDYNSALKLLDNLMHLFKIIECEIGYAVTAYSVGHMKYQSNQNGIARERLKKALDNYQCLDHLFGEYYCLMTLVKLETKMKNKSQVALYNDRVKELNRRKKKGKSYFQSTSKNGRFVLRNDLDQFLNLMIEPCFKTKVVGERKSNANVHRERRQLKKLREAYDSVLNFGLNDDDIYEEDGPILLKSKSITQNYIPSVTKSGNESKSPLTSKSRISDVSGSRTPKSKKSFKAKKRSKMFLKVKEKKKVKKFRSKSPKFGAKSKSTQKVDE